MLALMQCRRPRFDPWVGKIPWRRKCQLTPVFLPGEFHRQRSLVGYSPWSHKELDTTERLIHTLNWLLSTSDGQPLCSSSSRLSSHLQNFLNHHCTVWLLAVPGPNGLLTLRVVSTALGPILNWNNKIAWICFLSNISLLLLSHFSCVQLCATPWPAAYQAPPSMGFSRQEYWSGVPLPSLNISLV